VRSITPYITHTIRQLGDLVLDLGPPDAVSTTRLDLEPRARCSPAGQPRNPGDQARACGAISTS
jgi:hypothetical protein